MYIKIILQYYALKIDIIPITVSLISFQFWFEESNQPFNIVCAVLNQIHRN